MHAVQRTAEGVAAAIARTDAATIVKAFDEHLSSLSQDLARVPLTSLTVFYDS